MQHIYYIDSNFVKEHSSQYVLSIRYATDGLSFCVHAPNNRLLAFFYQPFRVDSIDAVIAKVKQMIVEEELLHLNYRKVYLLPCNKEKMLLPAQEFDKETVADMYRLCLHTDKNETLIYRKIRGIEMYLVESLPRNFVTFLTTRYPSLYIANSAYPFITHSLSNILFNGFNLFIDIHERYFDLLLTKSSDILLFNSFAYGSVNDMAYYALNCLEQCQADREQLQTTLSGNLVNDPILTETLGKYLPNIAVLNYAPLSQLVQNNELNSSTFIHLLNIHKCE